MGTACSAGTHTTSEWPPYRVSATTREPTRSAATPSPALSITPAASYPITHGSFGLSGYSPWAAITSAKHSPAARTRIRTCPGPGSGSGDSRTSSPAGPAELVIHTARMIDPFHSLHPHSTRGRGPAAWYRQSQENGTAG